MCNQCLYITELYLPHLNANEVGDLLMNATAYPFGTPQYIMGQIVELLENTDGSLHAMINFSMQQFDEEFKRWSVVNKLKTAGDN